MITLFALLTVALLFALMGLALRHYFLWLQNPSPSGGGGGSRESAPRLRRRLSIH